jgi:hypothetical protein
MLWLDTYDGTNVLLDKFTMILNIIDVIMNRKKVSFNLSTLKLRIRCFCIFGNFFTRFGTLLKYS